MSLRNTQGSGQVGIWVAGQETIRRLVVYEGVIGQAPDGADITEGVPDWRQAGMLLVEFVFVAPDTALAISSRSMQVKSSTTPG